MIWVLVIALLAWMPGSTTWQSLWIERWGIIVATFGVFSIYKLKWQHWLFPVSLSYVFLMSVVAAFKGGFGIPVPWDLGLMLQHSSLYWLACMLSLLLFLHIPLRPREFLVPLQLGALVILVGMILAKNSKIFVPILGNPSIAACYIVLMSFWGSRWWLLMGVIACVLSGAASPTAAFAVGVFMVVRHKAKWLAVPVLGLLTLWYLKLPGVDSGRFVHWDLYLSWWVQQSPLVKLFGTGLGTTKVILPYISLKTISIANTNTMIAPWLHNDWMQFFGELGVVGICIIIPSIIMLFRTMSLRGKTILLVYATIAIINFPSHYPLLALSMWGLIKFGAIRRKPYEIY